MDSTAYPLGVQAFMAVLLAYGACWAAVALALPPVAAAGFVGFTVAGGVTWLQRMPAWSPSS